MKLEFSHLLPESFSPDSKVWVYQSSRLFTLSEALELEEKLEDFAGEWKSHGAKVEAFCTLLFGQFIILMADETKAGVSGCSTDSSVRFIKDIGSKYQVDLFNRLNLAFFNKEKIQVLPLNQLNYAMENGFLNEDTLFFNNVVQTKAQLENEWIIPIKKSWLVSRITSKSK